MSTDTSDKPGTSTRVRSGGGVRRERQEERGEEENVENEGADSLRDHGSGSQDQVVQRELILQRELNLQRDLNLQRELTIQMNIVRACAVILTLMFAIFTVRTVDRAMDCNSANDQLQPNCKNLTLYDNQALKIKQLESELNQLKSETSALLCSIKSCPSEWKKFGCSCYYRSTEKRTWEESREQCLKSGADLVIINSKEEQEFIRGLDSSWSGESWIGLNKTEGNWIWVDGTSTTGYWTTGVPYDERPDNNKDMNCAQYWHFKGQWRNVLCSYERAWICEMSLMKVQLSALLCEVKQK